MKSKIVILLLITISIQMFSQESDIRIKNLDVNLSQSLYSIKAYSYHQSQASNKFNFESKFSPKVGLEFSFGKGSHLRHGILLNIYTYDFVYSLDCPEICIDTSFNIHSLVGFYDHIKFGIFSLEYSISYKLNSHFDVYSKLGFEYLSGGKMLNPYNGDFFAYHSTLTHQSYSRKMQLSSKNILHSFLFSIGGSYKLNEKFYLLFSVDSKPFSQLLVYQNVKYDEEDIDELSIDVYRRYINFSLGLKYRIRLTKSDKYDAL